MPRLFLYPSPLFPLPMGEGDVLCTSVVNQHQTNTARPPLRYGEEAEVRQRAKLLIII